MVTHINTHTHTDKITDAADDRIMPWLLPACLLKTMIITSGQRVHLP